MFAFWQSWDPCVGVAGRWTWLKARKSFLRAVQKQSGLTQKAAARSLDEVPEESLQESAPSAVTVVCRN